MNLTKTILVGVVYFCATISLFSANITIIESQSIHPLHKMDENWQNTATSLGYTANIASQTFLDDINNLNNTDVLIISSGLINLPANRQQNIKLFVEQGGNLYIQSEYLINLPGNQLFDYLVDNLGGSFNWDGELIGSLSPMNVIGDLSDNFTNVSALTYFWYGTYGSGDATIHSILEYNNLDWGFIFCPVTPTYGKIITTSDQDWVRTLNSEELMTNILSYLVTHMPLSTLPTVSISTSESGPCDDITYTFDATIQNYMGGTDFQWTVNGSVINGATDSTFIISDLVDGDVVECQLILSTFCTSYTHTSNPILIAPINPVSNATLEIVVNGDSFCENEDIIFTSNISNLQNGTNLTYQWTVNGTPITGETSDSFVSSSLNNLDTVNCILTFDDNCLTNNSINSTPIILNINPSVTPVATITADQATICEGETITFSITGNNLGNNPIFQWQIDGLNAGNDSPTFSTNILSEGQNITCTISTDQNCATMNTILTNTITANVLPLTTPSISISPDATEICPGEPVTFTATGENFGNNPTFQWQIDGLTVGSNLPEFTTNQLVNGQLVSCTLIADLACPTNNTVESNQVAVAVSENAGPTIFVESNTNEICEGEEVIFTATGSNFGSNPVFQWFIDGTPNANQGAIFSTTDLNNNQTVTCQITNSEACSGISTATSNPVEIKVNDIDVEILEIALENCGNADGMIEIEGVGGSAPYTYEWMNGSNESFLTDLSYGKLTVTVTDAIGCTTIGQLEMGKNDAPEIHDIDMVKADCDGENGSATLTMQDSTMTYTYEWLNESGTTVSYSDHAENLKVGTYTILISNEFGCATTETITVDQIPGIELIVSEDLRITLGESVRLETSVNSVSGYTIEWISEEEDMNCTHCLHPTISPTESSTYTVIATNEHGCVATEKVNVHVIPRRDVYIPNAFTPNNDGINDYFTIYAGENVKNIKSMQVFNRWGGEVFSKTDFAPNDDTEGWNGIHKGRTLQSGVYVYLIEVEYIDGKTKLHKGDIAIAP